MPEILENVVEILLLLAIIFFDYLKLKFKRKSSTNKVRHRLIFVLAVIAIINNLIAIFTGWPSFLSDFIRPVIFSIQSRSVREGWKRYILMMWDSRDMIFFIAAFISFYSWIGFRVFTGTSEG